MAPLGKEPRRFVRAAGQRLKEARFLLQHEYNTAAVYLGGYAVECMLKALILASEPEAHHAKTMTSFRGGRGHDFDWLRLQLDKRRVTISAPMLKFLADVDVWTTNLRYDPSSHGRRNALTFLAAAEEVTRWVRERL